MADKCIRTRGKGTFDGGLLVIGIGRQFVHNFCRLRSGFTDLNARLIADMARIKFGSSLANLSSLV